MDSSALFPRGYHPIKWDHEPDGLHRAKPKQRRHVEKLKYYFIDFELSNIFKEGESHLVEGKSGLDRMVPEFRLDTAYDAFPVDIFTVGNVFQNSFLEVLCIYPSYISLWF